MLARDLDFLRICLRRVHLVLGSVPAMSSYRRGPGTFDVGSGFRSRNFLRLKTRQTLTSNGSL